jgi:hypothetical protein
MPVIGDEQLASSCKIIVLDLQNGSLADALTGTAAVNNSFDTELI